MTATLTEDIARTSTTDDPGNATHIVWVPPGSDTTAAALVLEARVEGKEIEALCGHRWIPFRNPTQYPICERCLEIYQQPGQNRDDREDLPDA